MNRGFSGYPIEREDRDFLRATALRALPFSAADFDAPDEIDPRKWHRIENQGSMGSCQGHALTSVCEMAYLLATGGDVVQFSPMWAYLETQRIDGLLGRDAGSTIAGGLRCASERGMCPLDVFPYPSPVRYSTHVPAEAAEAAAPYRIRAHRDCRSYADVYEWIASGQGGVEIGISWGLEPDARGVVERFRAGGGGHAVAFLGYSRRVDDAGRKYLWLANSWDVRWGHGGWAEVAPVAVDAMGRHQYTVMIGMSDLSTPKPRHYDFIREGLFG